MRMASAGGGEAVTLQRLFAKELTARRETEGLSRVKLAELLGCTRQWLDKVETLERVPSEALADDLDTYFKTGGTFRRIRDELEEARKLALIPTGFRPVLDIERQAKQIRLYEALLVPGLFQTEAYARAVFEVGHPSAVVEEQVGVRMSRQALLEKADAPWIFALLRESVLRDVPRDLRSDQCKRLLELSDRFHVFIQLLPLGARVFESGSFQLISTAPHEIAYVEAANSAGQIIGEPDKVAKYALLFERARAAALSADESRHLIQTIMEDA